MAKPFTKLAAIAAILFAALSASGRSARSDIYLTVRRIPSSS